MNDGPDYIAQALARIEALEARVAEQRIHFSEILAEKDRAIEMAESEREKAAQALANALERSILAGDDRLREHIANQIQQIRDALTSADKLELARLDVVAKQVEAMEKAVAAAFEASETAIGKAEVNAEKWRDNANEWRGQSADRERTQAEQISNLTQTLMPRELAESKISELRNQVAVLQDKISKIA